MTTLEYSNESNRGGSLVKAAINKRGGSEEQVKSQNTGQQSGNGLSKDYAYQWSYGMGESYTLITPFYMGDASNSNLGEKSETYDLLKSNFGNQVADQLIANWPTYYGTQPFTSGPVYVGAIVFFLFILGLLVVPGKYKWWLLSATILGIMLAWGKNWQWFSDIFFEHLPKYNNFRAVSMMLVLAEICMPILAILVCFQVYTKPR